ncbi:zinc finger protein 277-like [Bolinopsis microptera]|uniref:zinc finger protein 277-like n=1 Tax=Bolinopsis microptera TaxID=2820187 RepID=UPI00307901B5
MVRAECLYCDKTFRDYKTLREHMRKKLHKKLNPSNTEFDKYYIVNYREFGKSWKTLSKDDNDGSDSRNGSPTEEDWSDWEGSAPEIQCLVCSVVYSKFTAIKQHMRSQHRIDLDSLCNGMSYYKQVKLINYIRYLIMDSDCPFCDQSSLPDISKHLLTHMNITSMSHERFNDDRYLFPALDNDFMLCCLKDVLVEGEDVLVIPEDIPQPHT